MGETRRCEEGGIPEGGQLFLALCPSSHESCWSSCPSTKISHSHVDNVRVTLTLSGMASTCMKRIAPRKAGFFLLTNSRTWISILP